mgnify:CR=1 FL=1
MIGCTLERTAVGWLRCKDASAAFRFVLQPVAAAIEGETDHRDHTERCHGPVCSVPISRNDIELVRGRMNELVDNSHGIDDFSHGHW